MMSPIWKFWPLFLLIFFLSIVPPQLLHFLSFERYFSFFYSCFCLLFSLISSVLSDIFDLKLFRISDCIFSNINPEVSLSGLSPSLGLSSDYDKLPRLSLDLVL